MLYADGQGVETDFVRGYMWLSLSAAGNVPEAVKYRPLVGKQLNLKQQAEAAKKAYHCKPQKLAGCD
jgi:uncharacterized membrane protein